MDANEPQRFSSNFLSNLQLFLYRRMYQWKLCGVVFVVFGLGFTVTADPLQLDPATLIDGLARHGMTDLLDRYDQQQLFDDGSVKPLIEIARRRIVLDYDANTLEEQLQAFDDVAQSMRSLINEHYDHEQRPLWQTDLAELLLMYYLQKLQLYATEYCEFGVPTSQQRQTRDSAIPEILMLLADAELRFFQLQSDLPRDPDHFDKRVATGLWDRMMKKYYKATTTYLLGIAAYQTALLDQDHPYYQNLGNNPHMPRQKNEPDQERARLLDLAIEKLSPFVRDDSDPHQVRLNAICITGRAMLRQPNNVDQGRQQLQTVIRKGINDYTHLLAQLAEATTLDQTNQHTAAEQLLIEIQRHPAVQDDLLLKLLVTDATHLSMLAQAQSLGEPQRAQSIDKAYGVYDQLLADPSLGDYRPWMKNYVYKRWKNTLVGGQDVAKLPPPVVRAVGEIALIEGQNMVLQAQELDQAGQAQAARDLRKQARPELNESIRLNTQLVMRNDLPPVTRAEAMLNLGWAKYFSARGDEIDTALELEAANLWVDLADEYSSQPMSEQAISAAIAVLHGMYDGPGRAPEMVEAYERACEVLFARFPTSEAADNERLYYAFHVLSQRGRYQEAVDVLDQIPPTHSSYFEARRELLVNLKAVLDRAEKPADTQVASQRLTETAQALLRQTDQMQQLTPDAHAVRGWAKLALVDVAMARNDIDNALAQLDGFENEFASEPELVRQALQRGIVVQAQAGRFDEVVNRAQKMMQLFPDDASIVIDEVLIDLDRRIDSLRLKATQTLVADEARQLQDMALGTARAAEQLARLLREWALKHNLTEGEMLFYDLLLAKAVRMAGKPDGAIDLLLPLLETYPQDPTIMHNLAESLFAKGDEKSLIDSGNQYYDTLIAGLESEDEPQLKRLWWNAWMRRLQISDKLNQGTEVIALRVRQLEVRDPSLGGEPFRSEMKRLELKHTQ